MKAEKKDQLDYHLINIISHCVNCSIYMAAATASLYGWKRPDSKYNHKTIDAVVPCSRMAMQIKQTFFL